MALIYPTWRPIVIDVGQPSQYSTHWTSRRAASEGRITTRSVMGMPTFQARPSPPRTCATTPKILKVAPYRGGGRQIPRERKKQRESMHHHQIRRRRRGTCWCGIYKLRGLTAFTTFMLWILTPSLTCPRPQRSAWRLPNGKRSGITSLLD